MKVIAPEHQPSRVASLRPPWRPLLAVLLLAVAGMALALWLLRPRLEPLPVFALLPDFSLTERSGRTVTRSDLDGRPWVADFIFTRCTGMCPALSAQMRDLRRRAAEVGLEARFVSFSVDPAHDTPAVLADYAERFGAGDDWLFLTGERDALYDLIGGGFKLSVAERSAEAVAHGGELIAHSDRFVLIDGAGQIRGYYHGTEAVMADRVLADLATLGTGR